jgi:hypothetical protein
MPMNSIQRWPVIEVRSRKRTAGIRELSLPKLLTCPVIRRQHLLIVE